MNKQELLTKVQLLAHENEISEAELVDAFTKGKMGQMPSERVPLYKRLTISEVLYYIGAFIIFIGIIVLIWQNWNALSSFARVLVTLGSSIALYMAGVLLARYQKFNALSIAFHLLAGILLPLGLGVAFYESGLDIGTLGMQVSLSGLVFAVYLLSFVLFRRTLFLAFTILFGTWFYFVGALYLLQQGAFASGSIMNYLAMVAGLAYIFLGYGFSSTTRSRLSSVLYGLGIFVFLGASIALSGIWEILYVGFVFAAIFLSIYLRSRAFLGFGALFLMAYILKITAKYFTGSFGWPFSLVLAGCALIGIGYLTLYLNRRYISGKSFPENKNEFAA